MGVPPPGGAPVARDPHPCPGIRGIRFPDADALLDAARQENRCPRFRVGRRLPTPPDLAGGTCGSSQGRDEGMDQRTIRARPNGEPDR